MNDTVMNAQIQLLGEMSEELAAGYRHRTMPGWQRDELARDFRELNAKLAPKKAAPKGATKASRSKLNKDGAAVVDTKSSDWTHSDTIAYALFAIIVICASIVIYANI